MKSLKGKTVLWVVSITVNICDARDCVITLKKKRTVNFKVDKGTPRKSIKVYQASLQIDNEMN